MGKIKYKGEGPKSSKAGGQGLTKHKDLLKIIIKLYIYSYLFIYLFYLFYFFFPMIPTAYYGKIRPIALHRIPTHLLLTLS